MKILATEEKFINLLTGIVWWFDVRWNKGTLFAFFFFSFIFPAFFGFLSASSIFFDHNDKSILQLFVHFLVVSCVYGVSFLTVSFIPVLLYFFDKRINALKQVKYSPNPNRHNGWIWKARFMFFVQMLTTFWVVIEDKSGFVLSTLATCLIMDSIIAASCYVLCVDPIPPAEKKERLKRNKTKNLKLTLNPTTG